LYAIKCNPTYAIKGKRIRERERETMHTRLELIGKGRMKRKWWVGKSSFPRKENPNKVTCKTQVALVVSMELYVT
jgi:hypothetical protein